MTVHPSQCISDIRLKSKPVPSVLRLAVYDVPCDTEALRLLRNQRDIISSRPIAGGHGGGNRMGTRVP